jgi:ferredoxin
MKVSADEEKCCGAGNCVLVAPEVFDQRDDDGVVTVRNVTPPAELHEAVREAAEMCPAGAIRLED